MESLEHIRHSLAHALAAAVLELWPDTRHAIGPAIDDGFYFDFDLKQDVSEKDFKKIEEKMRHILSSWENFTRVEKTSEEAKEFYKDNPYKQELIDEFAKEGKPISFYQSGSYQDLCKGGHVKHAKNIDKNAFKLTRIAGAYWRGNSKRPMLTRIYGVAFHTKKELDDYINLQEEAKKRDHKKLGRELELFIFSDLVGPGLPLWTPKGTILRTLLDDFVWRLRKKQGYQKVEIPHITKKELYEKSGHWEKFKEELFKITTREGHEFAMKPMNCPHHIQIYNYRPRSYRELPCRYANTTMVYRDEQTGELSGLSRVRSITQDDAHVFCRKNQIKKEIGKIWQIIDEFYGAFGFPLEVHLSLRDPQKPNKYLGTEEVWQEAENQLRSIAKERSTSVKETPGEAAFYGPKIDFIAKDSLSRQWQVATIQLDMNQPERFDLTCSNEKGEKERIIMLHAAIMGAIERFLSILIEHYAGAFPFWLAPVQVALVPVSEKQEGYTKQVNQSLAKANVRTELFDANDTLGKRIREAQTQKIPYLLVVGEKEKENATVNVRSRDKGELGEKTLKDFLALAKQ